MPTLTVCAEADAVTAGRGNAKEKVSVVTGVGVGVGVGVPVVVHPARVNTPVVESYEKPVKEQRSEPSAFFALPAALTSFEI
jgi:hypothetical protein